MEIHQTPVLLWITGANVDKFCTSLWITSIIPGNKWEKQRKSCG